MKKVILTLGLAILVASCTGPSIEGVEHVNSISRGEGHYKINVDRYKLDGKHDYLLVYTKPAATGYSVCHDPECGYCKKVQESKEDPKGEWTW